MDHEGVFVAFLADVNCRISRASRGLQPLDPYQGNALEPLGGSKCPSDPQLQGTMTVGHCMSCLRHNIHTLCDLQTTYSGKNMSILIGKLREKWVEIIKNSGKTQGKLRENDAENSVPTLHRYHACLTLSELGFFACSMLGESCHPQRLPCGKLSGKWQKSCYYITNYVT